MSENVITQVIEAFGSKAALARAIGLERQHVHGWERRKSIPRWRRDAIMLAAERDGVVLPAAFLAEDQAA